MVAFDSFFSPSPFSRSLIGEHARRERETSGPIFHETVAQLVCGFGGRLAKFTDEIDVFFPEWGKVGRFHRLLASLFTQTGLRIARNWNFSRSPTGTDFRGTLNFI